MPSEHSLLSKLTRTLVLSKAEAEAVRAVSVGSLPVKGGQRISRAGDQPSRSFLLADGVACTSKVIAGGKRQITALHIAGDMPDLHGLGLKLLDGDIWALTDCRLASMAHKDLRDLNREHPRLREELWRTALVDASIY